MRYILRGILGLILLMAATLPLAAQDDNADVVLEHYDGTWEDVVKDLETLGLIPAGGKIRFTEDYVSLRGPGTPFNRYASDADDMNFVMGGELLFTSGGDEAEDCMLLARSDGREWLNRISIVAYIGAGIIQAAENKALYAIDWHRHEDYIFMDDIPGITNDTIITEDFDQPVHLVLVGINHHLTVFANGEPVLEDWEIRIAQGGYLFGMITDNESRCEANNLWAYGLPNDLSWSNCEARTTGAVNKRSGPGTTFDVAGKTVSGETYAISDYTVDDSGFTWWHLDDDSWVREDVVQASGMCRTLPLVESEEE